MFTYKMFPGTRFIGSFCAECKRPVGWSAHPKGLKIAEQAHTCDGGRMRTILVVDDYAPHAYALERLLSTHGFRVVTAGNGTQALERAVELPDLIVLDVGLPDLNGFEVCRRIKANPKTASIPVLFITASHCSTEYIVEAERCGASQFLFHPITPEELMPCIASVLLKTEHDHKKAAAATAGSTTN